MDPDLPPGGHRRRHRLHGGHRRRALARGAGNRLSAAGVRRAGWLSLADGAHQASVLEQLIAHSTDIVVATDRKGHVVYYNDGAQRILGYATEEVLGAASSAASTRASTRRKRVTAAMREPRARRRGRRARPSRRTFLAQERRGDPGRDLGTLLHDEQGEEDGTIGFAKDLREILHKEQLATLGEVAIGLSHEINNPLAVILNQVELLERDIERRWPASATSPSRASASTPIRREIGRVTEILERLGEMVRDGELRDDRLRRPGAHGRSAQRGPRAPGARRPRLRGLRILVVDDDGGICRTLQEILEADGCQVETARDGDEALAKARRRATSTLVLSDVVMPNMDGYELFSAIRELHPDLPVLMMTAFHYDKDHIIKRSRLDGLEGVIFKKPVDPDRLRDALFQAVGGSRKSEG